MTEFESKSFKIYEKVNAEFNAMRFPGYGGLSWSCWRAKKFARDIALINFNIYKTKKRDMDCDRPYTQITLNVVKNLEREKEYLTNQYFRDFEIARIGVLKRNSGISKIVDLYHKGVLSYRHVETKCMQVLGGKGNWGKGPDGGVDGHLKDGTPVQIKASLKKQGRRHLDHFYKHAARFGVGVFVSMLGFKDTATAEVGKWEKDGIKLILLSLDDLVLIEEKNDSRKVDRDYF